MGNDDESIVALTRKLGLLIEKVISIETLAKQVEEITEKLAPVHDLAQKVEEIIEKLDTVYDLVNGRVTQMTEAMKKVAALEQLVAGEKGEARGAKNERARAKRETAPDG